MNNKYIIKENKVFCKIWVAQLISLFGDVFYDVAIVWYLVEKTGSALVAGGISVSTLLGKLFGSMLITQYVDRINTKTIMIATDFLRGIILVGTLLLIKTSTAPIMLFYSLSFIISFFTACFTPARQKSVTEIVSRDDLIHANAFDSMSGAIVQIFSWILGGLVVARFGVFIALSINTISFFVSLFFVLISSWNHITSIKKEIHKRFEFLSGIHIISGNSVIKSIVLLELIYMCMMGFYWSALPIKVNEIGDAFYYGLQGAAFGIGYFITSTILSKKKVIRIGAVYLIGLTVHWFGNFSAGISPQIILFITGVFIAGLGNSFWQIGKMTVFQTSIKKSDIGKVLATIEMLVNFCLIPAWIIGGYLADKFSPTIVMLSIGVVQIVAIIFVFSKKIIFTQKLS